jgi:hypothetical protein
MIVGKGSMSFRSFTVMGPNVGLAPEAILQEIENYAFDGFAGEEGRARGWVSLDHLLDVEFSREKNMRGNYMVFALRVDTRRVPPAIYKAHCVIELKATQEALGVAKVPLAERREIRRRIKEQLLNEVTPSSKAIGLVWNLRQRLLHVMSTSRSILNDVADLFDRSFELSLEERNPSTMGLEAARKHDSADAFRDVMPTAFYAEPASAK